MTPKKVTAFLSIGAILCFILALWGPEPSALAKAVLFSFPFSQIGEVLRWLSLASPLGNLVAILLYGAIGLCPLLVLLWRGLKKRAGIEDSLLVVTCALLFFMLYVLINPALIRQYFVDLHLGKAVMGGAIYSVLIGYLVLRLLRRLSCSESTEMLNWLQLFLALIAAMQVAVVFYLGAASVISTIQEVKGVNTDPHVSLAATNVLIVIRYVLQQIPAVLSIRLLLLAMELAAAMKKEKFGREAVEAAARLGGVCKLTVAVIVVTTIAANLMQLALSKSLLNVSFAVNLPLSTLVLTLILLVLAQYLDDTRKLSQDNQLII